MEAIAESTAPRAGADMMRFIRDAVDIIFFVGLGLGFALGMLVCWALVG